jgi:hypothetical protein
MKKLFIICLLIASSTPAFCQTQSDTVKKVINRFFETMRNADTTEMRYTINDDMIIQSLHPRKGRNDSLATTKADDFIKIIGAPHKDVYDERITFGDVKISNNLATVWAPYKFYLGKKFSHCGIDVFQLMKTNLGWKIVSVFYDIRTGNCPD